MRCPYCNKKVQKNSVKCKHCGRDFFDFTSFGHEQMSPGSPIFGASSEPPLSSGHKQMSPGSSIFGTSSDNSFSSDPLSSNTSNEKRSKRSKDSTVKKGLIVLLIGVVLLIAVICFISIYTRRLDNNKGIEDNEIVPQSETNDDYSNDERIIEEIKDNKIASQNETNGDHTNDERRIVVSPSIETETINIGECYYKPVEPSGIENDNGIWHAKNQLLIESEMPKLEIERLAQTYDARIVGYIELTGDYQLEFNTDKSPEELGIIINELKTNPVISMVSLNYIDEYQIEAVDYDVNVGNDPTWRDRIDETDNTKGASWGAKAIEAPAMWEILNENKALINPINVGVVDEGFVTNNEDIEFSYVVSNSSEIAHGTHVSGTMAARGDNDYGICGIYPYSRGQLYAASFADTFSRNSCMEEKITFLELICRNVKVINCSYGYVDAFFGGICVFNKPEFLSEYNNKAQIMGSFLQKLLDKGYDFLICCAAGNSSGKSWAEVTIDEEGNCYYDPKNGTAVTVKKKGMWPFQKWVTKNGKEIKVNNLKDEEVKTGEVLNSLYSSALLGIGEEQNSAYQGVKDRIICVGAVGKELKRSTFSNGGERVDIYAPGENIYSLIDVDRFGIMNGTSMAAPHVSGICANVWASNNNLSGADVKRIVCGQGWENNAKYCDDGIGNEAIVANGYESVKQALIGAGGTVNDSEPSLGGISEYVICVSEKEEESNIALSGVEVSVYDSNGEWVDSEESDDDGHIEIILKNGTYNLEAHKDGYITINEDDLIGIQVNNGEVTFPDEWIKMKKEDGSEDLSDALPIDSTTFPDPGLRKYMSDYYDKDQNGVIDYNEQRRILAIYIYNGGISSAFEEDPLDRSNYTADQINDESSSLFDSLSESLDYEYGVYDITGLNQINGIAYLYYETDEVLCEDFDGFSNLLLLKYVNNTGLLASLDLRNCSKLTAVLCSNSDIYEMELEGCTNLFGIDCSNNQIEEIDVSVCPKLNEFGCYNNSLEYLDVTSCPELEVLLCYDNNLRELDVTQNTHLRGLLFGNNNISDIDVSNCPDLEMIGCLGNLFLTRLDLTNNKKVHTVNCEFYVSVKR